MCRSNMIRDKAAGFPLEGLACVVHVLSDTMTFPTFRVQALLGNGIVLAGIPAFLETEHGQQLLSESGDFQIISVSQELKPIHPLRLRMLATVSMGQHVRVQSAGQMGQLRALAVVAQG